MPGFVDFHARYENEQVDVCGLSWMRFECVIGCFGFRFGLCVRCGSGGNQQYSASSHLAFSVFLLFSDVLVFYLLFPFFGTEVGRGFDAAAKVGFCDLSGCMPAARASLIPMI